MAVQHGEGVACAVAQGNHHMVCIQGVGLATRQIEHAQAAHLAWPGVVGGGGVAVGVRWCIFVKQVHYPLFKAHLTP